MTVPIRTISSPHSILLVIFVALLAYAVYRVRRIGSRPAGLPLGPPTEAIWGNLKQLPESQQEYKYIEWAKHYGPVYSIMKGPYPYIIVNDPHAARELFTKLGQHTAARPYMPVMMMARAGYEPAQMSGSPWRAARKQWHSMLNVGASIKYLPYQELEATKLIFDVVRDPESWEMHIPRYSNSVAMTMTTGHRVAESDDPLIQETLKDFVNTVMFGFRNHRLNFFPSILNLLDTLSPFKKEAVQLSKQHRAMAIGHYNRAKRAKLPSFYEVIQQKQLVEGFTEAEAAELGQSLLTAGTDTTASSLHGWVAAMAVFPEVQRKAQEEIDRVVGSERMPRDEDAPNLPYVRQVIQELHRWISVVPLGLTHATSSPLRWRGWMLPEGTGLIYNTFAIHNDPNIYPEPRVFKPERWEGKLEKASEDSLGAKSELLTFGAGRRICPGQHLAERNLFLGISGWLWAFNTIKAKDQLGNEIPIDINSYKPGLVSMLQPFKVSIKPRNEDRARLVQETWMDLRSELLDENEQWKKVPQGVDLLMMKMKPRD
ncbi:cytochrome p450 [Neofusicoccum parvum]|uniref:Cytochrome p450 n=1 Tax=Neofusicoccum parvum TaxID=310453 RepID=A0ACB5SF32_9PEZI|nr:cytochrome p450 [Neofusicoccum parvum]